MKTTVVLRAATLLVAGAFPLLASAQFQQPTSDELKMTSDPKAPGAAAVYLNIEEVADDNLHYQSYYARIKVLTEKGKELATVSVPYVAGFNKVTDIKARTIHPDGTVIPLEGKPEDLLTANREMCSLGTRCSRCPMWRWAASWSTSTSCIFLTRMFPRHAGRFSSRTTCTRRTTCLSLSSRS